MYFSVFWALGFVMEFKEDVFETVKNEVLNRLKDRFPSDELTTGTDMVFCHKQEIKNPLRKTEITIWRNRQATVASISADKGLPKEVSPEIPFATLTEALSFVPVLEPTFCSFNIQSALDLEGENKPLLGDRLFNLPPEVRVYGQAYETGLMFRWGTGHGLPGPAVIQLLPMNRNGTHVHCRCTLSVREKALKEQFVERVIPQGVEFLSQSLKAIPQFVNRILLG